MFDNWYSCLFTLVLLFLLSKNDRSGSSPQGGFVCFSALLSCFQTKMIFFLDYVRVYPFSESRISSVRVKTWFRSKKCLRCKRRFVCFGMNFKSIIWFRVKLCLSARENARWMLKRKCFLPRVCAWSQKWNPEQYTYFNNLQRTLDRDHWSPRFWMLECKELAHIVKCLKVIHALKRTLVNR